ncbi:MAG TPA: 16S rRNA (cytidine(1402)-2'-O)-methyltransferase [Patescibacteria group bacterium]|nr:16S rRNA (cytidine(1402)-2'-O)-methyltransferase [Patescibacteria group bacterium]
MLHIVGTPIGNLDDFSLRALEILQNAHVILCEDTRQTRKLTEHFKIKTKLISLHQHTKDEKIIKLLDKFDKVAYVSDAGTPGVSDPGGRLVELAFEKNIQVSPIPGPSAVMAALSVCGFPADKFEFLGFFPRKGKQKILNKIKDSSQTVCFFESPHRIIKTLEILKPEIGERKIMIGRELTKKFETLYRGTLSQVLPEIKAKGEFVIIISAKK